jgi:hypothetical protein
MQKFVEMSILIDCYGELLTQKQLEMLKMYYEDDYSLGEIGALFSISRQAAFDAIKKGEAALKKYEDKLEMLKKQEKLEENIAQVKRLLLSLSPVVKDGAKIDRINVLLDEISE